MECPWLRERSYFRMYPFRKLNRRCLIFRPHHKVVHWSALLLFEFEPFKNLTHIVVPPDMLFCKDLAFLSLGLPAFTDFPVRFFQWHRIYLVHWSLPAFCERLTFHESYFRFVPSL